MKQKTIKFGCYWIKVYKICSELRIDCGLLRFRDHIKKTNISMLAGSDAQLKRISKMGQAMTEMADELLEERRKDRL